MKSYGLLKHIFFYSKNLILPHPFLVLSMSQTCHKLSSSFEKSTSGLLKHNLFSIQKIRTDLVLQSCFQCHQHATNLVWASKNPPLYFLPLYSFTSILGPLCRFSLVLQRLKCSLGDSPPPLNIYPSYQQSLSQICKGICLVYMYTGVPWQFTSYLPAHMTQAVQPQTTSNKMCITFLLHIYQSTLLAIHQHLGSKLHLADQRSTWMAMP